KGHDRLRSDIEKMVQRLEPETSRDRAERAARERHVTMTPLADGMARVTAVLRGIDAVGMMKTLDAGAHSLRAAGEKTSASALEADLLVDSALSRASSSGIAPPDASAPDAPLQGAPPQDGPAQDAPAHAPRPRRARAGLEVGIAGCAAALVGAEDDREGALIEGYGGSPAHVVRDALLGGP